MKSFFTQIVHEYEYNMDCVTNSGKKNYVSLYQNIVLIMLGLAVWILFPYFYLP